MYSVYKNCSVFHYPGTKHIAIGNSNDLKWRKRMHFLLHEKYIIILLVLGENRSRTHYMASEPRRPVLTLTKLGSWKHYGSERGCTISTSRLSGTALGWGRFESKPPLGPT
jgi:hypothetical protein